MTNEKAVFAFLIGATIVWLGTFIGSKLTLLLTIPGYIIVAMAIIMYVAGFPRKKVRDKTVAVD